MVRLRFPLLFSTNQLPYSQFKVQNRRETLQVGSRAPEFSLNAANRDNAISLAGLLADGVLILEFLRGTW